jgi:putative oxidoreductase
MAGMERSALKFWVSIALRSVLAGLFFYAASLKLLDPATFQQDIYNFAILPWVLSGIAALYLPWLEIVAAGALFLGRRAGAVLLLALMLVFTAAIALAWARGLEISCGCFGATAGPTNYPLKLTENAAIIAGLVLWLWLVRGQASSAQTNPPHLEAAASRKTETPPHLIRSR